MTVFSADYANSSDGEETQQVQHSQQEATPRDDLWGYLLPFSSLLQRVEFSRTNLSYRLGRDPRNTIVFPGIKISNLHCSICWNGKNDSQSQVTILDTSSNGTFINARRIGNGRRALLHHGDEVSFGSRAPEPSGDYRFIYCHQGADTPLAGVFVQYDIGNELGKGAFATVFKARNRVTSEVFAVKLINTRRHLARNRDMAMFTREIEILMTLTHRNIVYLKEVFEDESNIALVMEFVRGGNLFDYVQGKQGLAEYDAKYITKQICEAMSYMHKNNIAHRDLKPENILLTDTIPIIAKIADFGLAKAFDNETFLKTMCGTPIYVAPEVITNGENHREYNNLVDSWSMGVTTFFMLTNTSPFIAVENQDILTYIRTRAVQWSRLERIRVSNPCLKFVQQLLAGNPTKRMSLSDSLRHPWLTSVQRTHGL